MYLTHILYSMLRRDPRHWQKLWELWWRIWQTLPTPNTKHVLGHTRRKTFCSSSALSWGNKNYTRYVELIFRLEIIINYIIRWNHLICLCSRNNLEIELIERNGSPCLPHQSSMSVKKKSPLSKQHRFYLNTKLIHYEISILSRFHKVKCVDWDDICFLSVPLLNVLSMHSKILTTKPYTELWSHVSGVTVDHDSPTTSVKVSFLIVASLPILHSVILIVITGSTEFILS